MNTRITKSKEELEIEKEMDKMVEEAFKPIYEGYEPYPAPPTRKNKNNRTKK